MSTIALTLPDLSGIDWPTMVGFTTRALGAGLVAVVGFGVKRGMAVLQSSLSLKLTQQQVDTVQDVARTLAGALSAKVQTGVITLAHVHPDSAHVQELVDVAHKMAPEAMAALGVTEESMAHMIVGRVANELPWIKSALEPSSDPPATPTAVVVAPSEPAPVPALPVNLPQAPEEPRRRTA